MSFNPGDKVIKKNDTHPENYGTVMDIPYMEKKAGYEAVYFQRKVWVMAKNLMPLDEWKAQHKAREVVTDREVKN